MKDFDPTIWAQARQRMPLPYLMTHLGDGSFTRKGAACPFCSTKGTWGLFETNGRHRFKCHHPGCVANEPPAEVGHGEIGYLILRKSLSQKDACLEYLKLAVPDLLEKQAAKEPKKETPKPAAEESPAPEPSAPPDDNLPPIISIETGKAVANEEPPKAPEPPKPNPWHSLWERLVLTPRDRDKLMKGRGFSAETIEALGFRSNNQHNRAHIESLRKEFPEELLLAEGILKRMRSEIRPNPQLLGWGLAKRAKKDSDRDEWDWTEPPLIPYLDDERRVFYMRPHKGGIVGPHDEDDEEETCSSHVYCPFLLANRNAAVEGHIVLTEGEYKAAALYQAGIPAIAIPGISFVRNRAFRHELIELLKRFAITDMVICFDNEVKDDPSFPNRYKPDPWDRYDTEMWAEYIAIDLTREYFGPHRGTARIGLLPDNLREDGKADFDSVLSYFVGRKRDVAKGTAEAAKVFQKLIEDALPYRQSRDLFPSQSRRIRECKLQRLFYKSLVPSGGDAELKLAHNLKAIGDSELSDAFRKVVGCYYSREKPERDERKVLIATARDASERVDRAKGAGVNGSEIRELRLKARAAWERVKGMPTAVSDFTLNCEFKLHTNEGKAIRLVRIRNHNDTGKSESRLYRLTGAEMARGPEFMRFCYDTGRADWKGGQRLLADLCQDMDHHSYMRDIYEINYYGYHAESGMWFFGDCAFGPNGDLIEADASNIFWNAGIGYQVDASIDERGSTFEQGAPLMLMPQSASKKREIELPLLFSDFCNDMFHTIGGFDAWIMLGLLFGYAIAPEILKNYGGHPGIWLSGLMGEGKTTLARWILRVYGFKELPGIRINKGTTHVGMNRNLAQYSDLPVWFDEYRRTEIDADKVGVLRGAFDRNSASKGLMDHSNRTRSARLYTTPIITGESTSDDAATASRYANIIVSKQRRMRDLRAKINADSPYYYLIGHFLMRNRLQFAEKAMAELDKWMSHHSPDESGAANDPVRRIPDSRIRLTYGVAWAAFVTASHMIAGAGLEERESLEDNFKDTLFVHGSQALQDVASETFLSRFWRVILSGLQRGDISKKFFELRHVIVQDDGQLKIAQAGDEHAIRVCYIAPNPVYDEYKEDLRHRNEDAQLDLADLRRQFSRERYWVPYPKSETARVHRITINGVPKTTCWVIRLDSFPRGEELEAILDHKIHDDDDDDHPPSEPPPPSVRQPEPSDML